MFTVTYFKATLGATWTVKTVNCAYPTSDQQTHTQAYILKILRRKKPHHPYLFTVAYFNTT